jgi:hypothetical protein
VRLLLQHGNQAGISTSDQEKWLLGYTYEEIAWHRSRIRELINHLRDMFGESTPMMFRVRQHRLRNHQGGVMKIHQLDQSSRAICKEMGVKLFLWGERLEGFIG